MPKLSDFVKPKAKKKIFRKAKKSPIQLASAPDEDRVDLNDVTSVASNPMTEIPQDDASNFLGEISVGVTGKR